LRSSGIGQRTVFGYRYDGLACSAIADTPKLLTCFRFAVSGAQEGKEFPNDAFVGEVRIIQSETKVSISLVEILDRVFSISVSPLHGSINDCPILAS
jgi:hypothetical protein